MELAREKLVEFNEEEGFVRRNGICVRVLGELEMLEEGLREAAKAVTKSTAHNSTFVCVCVWVINAIEQF